MFEHLSFSFPLMSDSASTKLRQLRVVSRSITKDAVRS